MEDYSSMYEKSSSNVMSSALIVASSGLATFSADGAFLGGVLLLGVAVSEAACSSRYENSSSNTISSALVLASSGFVTFLIASLFRVLVKCGLKPPSYPISPADAREAFINAFLCLYSFGHLTLNPLFMVRKLAL